MEVIEFKSYGCPSVLYRTTSDTPSVGRNKLLVKIDSFEVTKTDCEIRRGRFSARWLFIPMRLFFGISKPRKKILGSYFSGEVVALGENVKEFSVGDHLIGTTGIAFGAYAEFVSVSEHACAKISTNYISHFDAAALPFGANNAVHYVKLANIKQNDKLLINGGGGSIGVYIIQIAKFLGAEVYVVDSYKKKESLIDLGADTFIDYEKDDLFNSTVKFDAIINFIPSFSSSLRKHLLSKNGIYVAVNPNFMEIIFGVYRKNFNCNFAPESAANLDTVVTLVETGVIKPVVTRMSNCCDIVKAHQLLETEDRVGPIIGRMY